MIRIKNYLKTYNRFKLNIDLLTIEANSTYLITGKNGVGKTTLLKSIVDIIPVDEGTILIDGVSNKHQKQWKRKVRIYISEDQLIPFIHVNEYLKLYCDLLSVPFLSYRKHIEQNYQGLSQGVIDSDKRISELSTGNKQKLGILSCLIGHPKLILLDEPFNHLDQLAQQELIQIIKELKKTCSIVFTGHNLAQLSGNVDHVIKIENNSITTADHTAR